MRRPIENFNTKIGAVMQCHTQAATITANLNIKIDFTLPELIGTKIVTSNCSVYDSAKGIYHIILGRYLLTAFWLNLKGKCIS